MYRFLFFSYLSGILFVHFDFSIVLPTLLILLFSNVPDYASIALHNKNKTKVIRAISTVIMIVFVTIGIFCAAVLRTNNADVITFINKWYIGLYIISAVVWVIPFVDGFRGTFDAIIKSADVAEKQIFSARPYNVMCSISKK